MSQYFVKDVMQSMGWSDGSNIPIANEENKKLLEQINELIRQKAAKESTLQYAGSRCENLIEHFKNSEYDISHNLKLINAYRSQLTTDNHMLKLAEHDDSRLKQQIKELTKGENDLNKYENATNNEIEKVNKNIDQVSNKINWAKSALVEWRQAMAKGEETNKLIEKYCMEDQSKANAIDSKRRIIQDNIIKQKKILIDAYEEQKSLEQTLERTAQLYQQAHAERRQMIGTWKEAVNQMNQREQDIHNAETELDDAKQLCIKKTEQLKEQEEFLNYQIQNNKQVEYATAELNGEISSIRKQITHNEEEIKLEENQLSSINQEVQSVSQKLQNLRQRNRQNVKRKTEKEQHIERLEVQLEDLEKRYEKFQSKSMNAQERLNQLDEIIETEEKAKIQLSQEISRIDGMLYRSQQQLNKMKDDEKLLTLQNRAVDVGMQSVQNSLKELEKELQRRTETAYNLGFKVQQLEMRIAKVKGTTSECDPEKDARLIALEKQNDIKSKQLILLQAQISKVEDDMRKLTQSYNNDTVEIDKMTHKIKEKQLFCEGGDKKLKAKTQANQEQIVELSLIKMRVHQMEKQIAKHEDKSYTLEKHRIELETAMTERLIDIKTQIELLFAKKKHLMDEMGTLKLDIKERLIKIDAMKKRFELAIELMGKNEDGSVVTATQLKIEAAQEKQMLLQEGNELNAKVLKAEDEIKAMENTLCLLNFSNDSYRKTFEQVDEQNPDLIELKELQGTYCKILNRLKTLRNTLELRTDELTEMQMKRDYLEGEAEESSRNRLDNNDVLMKLQKELAEQITKIQRAERELKCAYKSLKQKNIDEDYLYIFEKDLVLRELEERNTTALQQLADLVDTSDEMGPIISKHLYEKGVKFPQVRRIRSQVSCRSDYSERSISESSLKLFSASSKGSVSCSSLSSKYAKAVGSAQPSIVSIDFPPEGSITKKDKKSTKSSSSKNSMKT